MAMIRIVRSQAARTDLKDIWRYIAQDDADAADRLIRQIDATIRNLVKQPSAGRLRPELRANLRSFPVGRYVIFYKALEDGVHIYRVLHGSRYFDILL